eukprot:ANDGO_02483.mRNA.1 hypothetical protein
MIRVFACPFCDSSTQAVTKSMSNNSTGSASTASAASTATTTRISSQRYDKQKTADPFATKSTQRTTFGTLYNAGGVPCRIQHTTSRMYLAWDTPPDRVPDFASLFVACADGLRETQHPHVFVAVNAFIQMCQSEGAYDKIVPLLSRVVPLIKTAMSAAPTSSTTSSAAASKGIGNTAKATDLTFENALNALSALSACVGPALLDHFSAVLQALNKKFSDKLYAARITDVLQNIEEMCGPEASKIIKAKIPTYTTIHSLKR